MNWVPIANMVSPYNKKWTKSPAHKKQPAQNKSNPKGSAKGKVTKASQPNEKVYVPYYLRRYDPKLRTVILPSELLSKILLPGQKNIWIKKGLTTNLKGSRFVDT